MMLESSEALRTFAYMSNTYYNFIFKFIIFNYEPLKFRARYVASIKNYALPHDKLC